VVLLIDCAGARSALALIDPDRGRVQEDVREVAPDDQLAARIDALAAADQLTAVLVGSGPGSFSRLRSGVSFGVGLALGLRLPLLHLGSLDLQAGRARIPVRALGDAGRGRVYVLEPGAPARLVEIDSLGPGLPLCGWVSPPTAARLQERGLDLIPPGDLAGIGESALRLLGAATRVGYDRVPIQYLSSFGRLRS